MSGFTAVLLYGAWTLFLPIFYASYRAPLIARGVRRADHWERGKPNEDSALLVRARNAHSNCVENFPVFAAVVCIAALMNKSSVVDTTAAYVLCARIAQSVMHLAGTSLPLVALRGLFYAVQIVLIIGMIWGLLR